MNQISPGLSDWRHHRKELPRKCGKPLKIIDFIQDTPVIERIPSHIGEPVEPLHLLPARGPPQGELGFDQATEIDPWPEMDQTAAQANDCWQLIN